MDVVDSGGAEVRAVSIGLLKDDAPIEALIGMSELLIALVVLICWWYACCCWWCGSCLACGVKCVWTYSSESSRRRSLRPVEKDRR